MIRFDYLTRNLPSTNQPETIFTSTFALSHLQLSFSLISCELWIDLARKDLHRCINTEAGYFGMDQALLDLNMMVGFKLLIYDLNEMHFNGKIKQNSGTVTASFWYLTWENKWDGESSQGCSKYDQRLSDHFLWETLNELSPVKPKISRLRGDTLKVSCREETNNPFSITEDK